MPLKTATKKTKLLRDTALRNQLKKNEDYREELEREISAGNDLAITLDDETAQAHNLYLFGVNGRQPVRDLEKLSRQTGVAVTRLKLLAPVWRREALRLAREASPLFAMAANEKSRKHHYADLEKMRVRIDEFEATLPETSDASFGAKYRMLMLMRKEWQDAAGVTAAIGISQAMILAEGKILLEKASGTKADVGGEPDDLSAFDVDV